LTQIKPWKADDGAVMGLRGGSRLRKLQNDMPEKVFSNRGKMEPS